MEGCSFFGTRANSGPSSWPTEKPRTHVCEICVRYVCEIDVVKHGKLFLAVYRVFRALFTVIARLDFVSSCTVAKEATSPTVRAQRSQVPSGPSSLKNYRHEDSSFHWASATRSTRAGGARLANWCDSPDAAQSAWGRACVRACINLSKETG
jgi:hypothetical protein